MKRLLLTALLGALSAYSSLSQAAPKPNKEPNPQVLFKTSQGDITIELFSKAAPITVKNFLAYVNQGFYNQVIFHRVIPGFVIQGGGFDPQYQSKATQPPIINESTFKLKNTRGTLSMARTMDPNSASSQFFINLQNNVSLDFQPEQPGYAVFGRVTDGMPVVDAIANTPQGNHSGVFENAPNTPIVILEARALTVAAQAVSSSTISNADTVKSKVDAEKSQADAVKKTTTSATRSPTKTTPTSIKSDSATQNLKEIKDLNENKSLKTE